MAKNSDFILDKLRSDLGYTAPELQGLRWEVAKHEIAGMVQRASKKREVSMYALCLMLGAGLGIYALKKFPQTKMVQLAKYTKAVLQAQSRLNKVVIEEYHRIDEAIETEEQFLQLIAQDIPIESKFTVIDGRDGQRSIHLNMKVKKGKKAKDDE